jgi:hypothetical protein
VVIPELAAALGGTTADAEWLSMNCVMVGTIPVMVIVRTDFAGTTDIGSVRSGSGSCCRWPLGEGGQALTVGAMDMADMSPSRVTVTRTQIAAVAVLTLTALGAGILLAAAFGDFSM